MKRILLSAACALAFSGLSFGIAAADPAPATTIVPQADVYADYNYIDANHNFGHVNDYGLGGSAILPLGDYPLAAQLDAGYHHLDGFGSGADNYNVGGSLAWTPANLGRLGAAVSYTRLEGSGAHADLTSYGAFGQWYADNRFTVGLKGGGATLSGGAFGFGLGSTTVGYAGGQVIGYATPDVAVTGTVDWIGKSNINVVSGGVQGEYLVSHQFPLSVFGGYTYTDYSHSLSGNTVSVGVKYYFGGNGSLEQHQRTGVDSWGPVAAISRLLF